MPDLLRISVVIWLFAIPITFMMLAGDQRSYTIKQISYTGKEEVNKGTSDTSKEEKMKASRLSSSSTKTPNGKLPELRFLYSPKPFSEKYYPLLDELGLTGKVEYIDLKNPLPNITIVSAVSENHAGEGRSMVARLAKDHSDWKLVLYDIGLKQASRIWFEKACNVEVRGIDLAHYGVAKLGTYGFKAVVIATALLEFPAVMWTDSSTFWSPNASLSEFVDRIRVSEQKSGPHVYIPDKVFHSTFAVTTKGMYDYLRPHGNAYQVQFQANRMLFYRTKETYELALKWYVLCSLEKECMTPKGHQLSCNFKNDPINRYANCHRYDQSAINLVLLPYKDSFLGNWTLSYLWTERGVVRNASLLLCGDKKE